MSKNDKKTRKNIESRRKKAERRKAKRKFEKRPSGVRVHDLGGLTLTVFDFGVGKRHPAWRPGLPEGYHYNFGAVGHFVYCVMSAPDADEVKAFSTGPWRFGLVEHPDALVLLLEWGGGCGDAPFNWHSVPPADRALAGPPEPGKAPGLHLHLIDSRNGRTCATRLIAPGFEFGRALESAIDRQAMHVISADAHHAAIAQLYACFPTPASMFAASAATWQTPGFPPRHS